MRRTTVRRSRRWWGPGGAFVGASIGISDGRAVGCLRTRRRSAPRWRRDARRCSNASTASCRAPRRAARRAGAGTGRFASRPGLYIQNRAGGEGKESELALPRGRRARRRRHDRRPAVLSGMTTGARTSGKYKPNVLADPPPWFDRSARRDQRQDDETAAHEGAATRRHAAPTATGRATMRATASSGISLRTACRSRSRRSFARCSNTHRRRPQNCRAPHRGGDRRRLKWLRIYEARRKRSAHGGT